MAEPERVGLLSASVHSRSVDVPTGLQSSGRIVLVEIAPPSKAEILQSIEDFLEAESSPPKPRQCRRCGTSMQFVDAHFLLRSTAMNWNVSLPFCPVCDREILNDLPPPTGTIH
jgi:hypothetical protein